MSDLNNVALCLEKVKSKNLGQNPDNLKHFLLKDFNCDCEDAIKLIDEAWQLILLNPSFLMEKLPTEL